jgi:hypothetical protein
MTETLSLLNIVPTTSPDTVVVRVKTSYWNDGRGLHTRKSLTYLKRKCRAFNFLAEDAEAVGAYQVMPRIINLDEVGDGVYEVITVNVSRDYESGYVEEWDYKLVPYDEERA